MTDRGEDRQRTTAHASDGPQALTLIDEAEAEQHASVTGKPLGVVKGDAQFESLVQGWEAQARADVMDEVARQKHTRWKL